MKVDREQLKNEVVVKAVLSSKKGGQHVNKASTQAQVFFDLEHSSLFSQPQKLRIKQKLRSRITGEGIIIVTAQDSRSLFKNREEAIEKLAVMLEQAASVPRARKKTGVPAGVREKRLRDKKRKSEVKQNRKNPGAPL